jgi:hypothetical protein
MSVQGTPEEQEKHDPQGQRTQRDTKEGGKDNTKPGKRPTEANLAGTNQNKGKNTN